MNKNTFQPKIKSYPCVCHVCGKEHEVVADFLSTGSARVMPDGTTRSVHSCGNHTSAEIKAAWMASQTQYNSIFA